MFDTNRTGIVGLYKA